MEERHLSLSEAADALGISERTAYRWIKSGKLRAYKPGRDYRIPESAIRELMERSEAYPKVEPPLPFEDLAPARWLEDRFGHAYLALGTREIAELVRGPDGDEVMGAVKAEHAATVDDQGTIRREFWGIDPASKYLAAVLAFVAAKRAAGESDEAADVLAEEPIAC